MYRITKTNLAFEREALAAPWGFKGGFLTEIWQIIARMEPEGGKPGIGLGVQSVLWSDPAVFAATPEAAGNSMMLLMTARALEAAREIPFATPPELLDALLPLTLDYGKKVTENPKLRLTFALNALVAVDNAAWLLHAAEQGIAHFDDLIPPEARPALSHRHTEVACVPAIGYGLSLKETVKTVEEGNFVLKIKIGSDPERDGDPEKMLAWDIARMASLHAALKDREARGAAGGRVEYYLDANGRYDSKERLFRLLDALEKMGALERTVLLEEPFPEEMTCDVRDIPVRVVADESAHTDADVRERIALGYGAIALKPAAKTLSMSFRMAQAARARGVPCFCADLTVNPALVDWNKVFAARLTPLPGRDHGLLETNGAQNYRNWKRMQSYHSACGAGWMEPVNGVFRLDEDFYARSGGIFAPGEHYTRLVAG